jgi:hypothetical protein
MSYTHTYRKTIRIPYSGSVSYSYGPSEHGGSGTAYYSGTAVEEVEVDILVDTDPFDSSVASCNRQVDVLTGSVVATESAQVASIKAKGKQIGDTVVEGFFNTVKFEISTQIVELRKQVEAHLLKMSEMQKRLVALKKQMESDYNHTTERYAKIFEDLNKELDNRVHALDQPVFAAANNMYGAEDRFMETDMLNVVALAGKENAMLGAQINTAIAKSHARKALSEANTFLAKKQATEITLSQSILDDDRAQCYYAPVCYAQVTNEHKVQDKRVYTGEMLPENVSDRISDRLANMDLKNQTEEERANVDIYFQNLVNETKADDAHAQRVKNIITKLYSL